MKRNVLFTLKTCNMSNNYKPMLENYKFWENIYYYFKNYITCVEIKCWDDEPLAIKSIEKYCKKMNSDSDDEIIYKGIFTDEFGNELINNYLSKDNTFKWFIINFYNNNKLIFHSGHYGTEMICKELSKEKLNNLLDIAQEYDIISKYNIF